MYDVIHILNIPYVGPADDVMIRHALVGLCTDEGYFSVMDG